MTVPSFDELVGGDVPEAERARLRRAHDLLVAAGPPPPAPPRLERVAPLERGRSRPLALLVAAALALAAFGAGWLARGGDDAFQVRRAVDLRATDEAPGAEGVLELGHPDESGNWEMNVLVAGLDPLPDGGYYVLNLTRGGEPVATCGTFNVRPDGTARVRLGASYDLSNFDGWVVQPWVFGRDRLNRTVVLRT